MSRAAFCACLVASAASVLAVASRLSSVSGPLGGR